NRGRGVRWGGSTPAPSLSATDSISSRSAPSCQYHLALCRLTAEATDRFGPVRLHRGSPPEVLSAASIDAGPGEPGSRP
ncbi:hypothetical protein ABZ726_20915, partial [Streptomyces hundungensis]|uniref:hypothetical protein n=1 Tax=Streptomyces hundungensis TaxID=1077946 RepID=UPI0033F14F02